MAKQATDTLQGTLSLLRYLLRNLHARQPASLEVCALFNKPKNRLIEIPLKYKGFDLPDRVDALTELGHFGLVGIRERAELIGAQLIVQSTPGSGTTIELHLPL